MILNISKQIVLHLNKRSLYLLIKRQNKYFFIYNKKHIVYYILLDLKSICLNVTACFNYFISYYVNFVISNDINYFTYQELLHINDFI